MSQVVLNRKQSEKWLLSHCTDKATTFAMLWLLKKKLIGPFSDYLMLKLRPLICLLGYVGKIKDISWNAFKILGPVW